MLGTIIIFFQCFSENIEKVCPKPNESNSRNVIISNFLTFIDRIQFKNKFQKF